MYIGVIEHGRTSPLGVIVGEKIVQIGIKKAQ
jgi:hypothetical protein